MEPGIKEMSTAFHEVFERYSRIFNPEGGEKVYSFDAHRLLESMCRIWAVLYSTSATSRKEVLRNKSLLEQEVQRLTENEDGWVKKLEGELDVCQKKLREVQDALIDCGTTILNLGQKNCAPLH